MGYAPAREALSTVPQHVIKVDYVHSPERARDVMAALDQVEAEAASGLVGSSPGEPTRRARLTGQLETMAVEYESMKIEWKVAVGGLAGALVGVAASFLFSLLRGDSADALALLGLVVIGLLFGALRAVPRFSSLSSLLAVIDRRFGSRRADPRLPGP
jgi:hypothetical protein